MLDRILMDAEILRKEMLKMTDDLINREALKKILSDPLYRSTIKDYGEILKYTFVMDMIDNAPTVADRYDEGYAQGYIDGSTGADWRGEEE